MADDRIIFPPDSTGKGGRTISLTVGGQTVHEFVQRSVFDTPERRDVVLYAVDISHVTTEALLTLSVTSNFVAGTSGTSHTVPAGKRWRVQGWSLSVKQNSGTAAVQRARVSLRVNPSGAAVVTSPVAAVLESGNQGAVLHAHPGLSQPFPFGIDLPPGAGVGISHIGAATTGHLTVGLNVVEYSAP